MIKWLRSLFCDHDWRLPVYPLVGPAPFKVCIKCGTERDFDRERDGSAGHRLPFIGGTTTIEEMDS